MAGRTGFRALRIYPRTNESAFLPQQCQQTDQERDNSQNCSVKHSYGCPSVSRPGKGSSHLHPGITITSPSCPSDHWIPKSTHRPEHPAVILRPTNWSVAPTLAKPTMRLQHWTGNWLKEKPLFTLKLVSEVRSPKGSHGHITSHKPQAEVAQNRQPNVSLPDYAHLFHSFHCPNTKMTRRDTTWNFFVPLKAEALHVHTQMVKAPPLTQPWLHVSHLELHNPHARKTNLPHHIVSAKKPEHWRRGAHQGNRPFTVYAKKHLVLLLDITTTIKTPAKDQEDYQGGFPRNQPDPGDPKRALVIVFLLGGFH